MTMGDFMHWCADHYFWGLAFWLILGSAFSIFLLREFDEKDGKANWTMGLTFITLVIAGGWPLEQFIVYAVLIFAALAGAFSFLSNIKKVSK